MLLQRFELKEVPLKQVKNYSMYNSLTKRKSFTLCHYQLLEALAAQWRSALCVHAL